MEKKRLEIVVTR